MGRIVISENITLDGVVQDPTGEESFRRGGWFVQVGSNDREAFSNAALDEALGAEALLLGRRSYEFLATRWPSRTGELADRLNGMPKYVVSSTLQDPDWNNSTVIKANPVKEVSNLKQHLNGEIVVPASRQLVHTLIDHGLVDELRLMVYPFVLGAGEHLFGETNNKLALTSSTTGPSVTASHTSPTRSSEPSSPSTATSRESGADEPADRRGPGIRRAVRG